MRIADGLGGLWRRVHVPAAHVCCCAFWCVVFLCPHSNVPLFSSFLLLNFQPGSSELGEGVILMGALEVGTCGGRAPVLPLVGVSVFCVPIPTSHYSSSYKVKEWDVDACALLTAWFPVCRAGVVCPVIASLLLQPPPLGVLLSPPQPQGTVYCSVQQKTHQSTVFSTVADRCSVQQSPPQHHLLAGGSCSSISCSAGGICFPSFSVGIG